MYKALNRSVLRTLTLLILASTTWSASAAGPREPLTARNVGQYGPWCGYFASKDLPFDFLIVQAIVFEDHIEWNGWTKEEKSTWNDYLRRARANGKRVIADVHPALYTEDGELQTLNDSYRFKKPVPVERFLPLFKKFFDEVDENELYAMTISEEHAGTSGQPERLNTVYDYVKKHFDIPAFQWYTPSRAGSIPGVNYPNLKADGWVADEYFLQQPAMELAMRAFVTQRKPVFQIIWASPDCKSVPWSERTFWEQFSVCRKYDVPTAFFCYADGVDGPHGRKWSWDALASPAMREVLDQYCVYAANLAKSLALVSKAEWDFVPWAPTWIPLNEPGSRSKYHETFTSVSGLKWWKDASTTGLADLKWDSSPLQLCPTTAGAANASIEYRFFTTGPATITVSIRGSTSSSGAIDLAVLSPQGKMMAQAQLDNGIASLSFGAIDASSEHFIVRCRMSGAAKSAGEVIAELAEMSVEAKPVKGD